MYALTGNWFINPEKVAEATAALKKLASDVQSNEPGTLLYKIFTPNSSEVSTPPVVSTQVTFFEVYQDYDAFLAHVNGDVFTSFVGANKNLFVPDFNGNIYMTGEILSPIGGFIRSQLAVVNV